MPPAQPSVRTAKTPKPVDIDAGYERVMKRYPRIMARLA